MSEYTPDFMKLADSLWRKRNPYYEKRRDRAGIQRAYEEYKDTIYLEFDIDPEDLVYPMVKPGGTLEDLIMDC